MNQVNFSVLIMRYQIRYMQSTLSRTDIFGTGPDCPESHRNEKSMIFKLNLLVMNVRLFNMYKTA